MGVVIADDTSLVEDTAASVCEGASELQPTKASKRAKLSIKNNFFIILNSLLIKGFCIYSSIGTILPYQLLYVKAIILSDSFCFLFLTLELTYAKMS
jgi:hypothetical protein